ncbi:MAG: hypothetical protein ACP5N2_04325 [Candidatus Nanoarchaeia archaeon]
MSSDLVHTLIHTTCKGTQNSEVDLNELAVILIDMTPYFIKYIAPSTKNTLLAAHKQILELCVQKNYPLLQVEMNQYGEKNQAKTMRELEQIARTAPRYERFNKTLENALCEKKIEAQLIAWRANYLLLLGINTQCIQSTANGARNKTYQVITAPELIAGPENDKITQIKNHTWLKNNTIYLDSHLQILDLMTQKP